MIKQFEKLKNTTSRVIFVLMPLFCLIKAWSQAKTSRGELTETEKRQKDLSALVETLHLVQQLHIEPGDTHKNLNHAMHGLAKSLDPHSAYFAPEQKEMFLSSLSGEFGGIGVVLTFSDSCLFLAEVQEGPAKKAGLKAGDLILEINNEPIQNDTLEEAVVKLRGPVNSQVKLKIYRPYEPSKKPFSLKEYQKLEKQISRKTGTQVKGSFRTLTLQRKLIKVPNAAEEKFTGDILYYNLHSFLPESHQELEASLKKNPYRGLILDLRNNPGGALDAAVQIVDLFLSPKTRSEKNVIVSTESRIEDYSKVYPISDRTPFQHLPLMVLVNNGSASASELAAAAFQDHQRALIIGDSPTFAKGSFQGLYPLSNGGALKLTTGYFFSPSGRRIAGDGVAPDVHVPLQKGAETPFIVSAREGKWRPQAWSLRKPKQAIEFDRMYQEGIRRHQIEDPQIRVAYYKILRTLEKP